MMKNVFYSFKIEGNSNLILTGKLNE